MRLTQECGQKWYRWRCWRKPRLRVLRWDGEVIGWAFGPVMLFKKGIL